jgi:penicillin-binding protein 2
VSRNFSTEDRIRLRVSVLGLVILSLVSVLASRLWFLQVLAGDRYAKAAETNRVRLVTVQAPRGRILDRNGKVLVGNRPSLAVGIRRDDLRDRAHLLPKLAKLLGISVKDIERRLADKRVSPYRPVIVAEDVPMETVLLLRERADEFPGVETAVLPVRMYPNGTLAAHVLGYVGETTRGELSKLRGKGYRLGDEIGRAGVERSYEEELRGRPGLDKLEVDATGHVLRSLGSQEARPGNDVQLSIDLEVQKVAEESLLLGIERARAQVFRETKQHFRAPAGGVVVLDAQTGEIVAMASYPTFDPARFVGGVARDYFASLNDPQNDFPLLNRALQAVYPPGSTFKPFVASAALTTGAATFGSTSSCTTEFPYGDRVFRNWRSRNATITLRQALIESCDTVFYRYAANWWAAERAAERAGRPFKEVMQTWARLFGLGRPTKVDLPSEAAGRVPDRGWRRAVWNANRAKWCATYDRTKDRTFEDLCRRGYLWRGGDAVNMSIGQGDVQATPLQMAVGYAAIANGGRILAPRVGMKVTTTEGATKRVVRPAVISEVPISDRNLSYIQGALAEVPVEGTARSPFSGWPLARIPVAAKTGSAEIAGKQPFSWFAAYAPADAPRYVAVSVVEQAGFGSQVSGPIVRRIMDRLFDLPLSPIVYGARSD